MKRILTLTLSLLALTAQSQPISMEITVTNPDGERYSLAVTNPTWKAIGPVHWPTNMWTTNWIFSTNLLGFTATNFILMTSNTASLPPMPPAPIDRPRTNRHIYAKSAPFYLGTVPGYPKFTVRINEEAKSKHVAKSVILPSAPPLSGTNVWQYIDPEFNVLIFSADVYGMAYGKTYAIETTVNLREWSNYYGPFTWQSQDPYAYLRWQEQIKLPVCVPEAPNGATLCQPTKRSWRIKQLP